jgi:hypothetical protein
MPDPRQGVRLLACHDKKEFEIVEDAPAGFYLYVREDTRCTHDYLQDTAVLAKEYALEKFGVPLNAWHQAL